MNPYESYYLNQAGSGLATYTGIRYQKGNGFFGRLISGFALPLLKYFGRQGLEAAGNVVTQIRENPEAKVSDILKKQAKSSLAKATEDGAERAKRFIQTGKGVKKYKRKEKTQVSKSTKPKKAAKPSRKKAPKKVNSKPKKVAVKKRNSKSKSFL